MTMIGRLALFSLVAPLFSGCITFSTPAFDYCAVKVNSDTSDWIAHQAKRNVLLLIGDNYSFKGGKDSGELTDASAKEYVKRERDLGSTDVDVLGPFVEWRPTSGKWTTQAATAEDVPFYGLSNKQTHSLYYSFVKSCVSSGKTTAVILYNNGQDQVCLDDDKAASIGCAAKKK